MPHCIHEAIHLCLAIGIDHDDSGDALFPALCFNHTALAFMRIEALGAEIGAGAAAGLRRDAMARAS
jgi:hypothetical protein